VTTGLEINAAGNALLHALDCSIYRARFTVSSLYAG
jgi:hypothetical protein